MWVVSLLKLDLPILQIYLNSLCRTEKFIQTIFYYLLIFLRFLFVLFLIWLRWVFVAAHRLSLVAASGGYSLLWCAGFSLRWLFLLRSTGSRCMGFSSCGTRASVVVACGLQSTGSVVVAHRLSCSVVCGIFLDQGLNPCPLHWQVDSQPLCHQGSPRDFLNVYKLHSECSYTGCKTPSFFYKKAQGNYS